MRTGPLSSTKVIDRLNAYFVPVYAVNEDYRAKGLVADNEKAEYTRIYRETLSAGMSAGTVHVYLLNPTGKVVGSAHVAEAAKTEKLIELLDRVIADLGVKAGATLVAPKSQSGPPPHERGSLVLHLTARPLSGGGSWDGTAENWIVYTPNEVKQLLPATSLKPGQTWTPQPALIARLLKHVYPVTENNDVSKNLIEQQLLSGRVISVANGVCRARLDGHFRMQHTFYFKPDGNVVVARLVGYIDFEPATGKVRTLKLVTHEATYGGGTFGVAVRSQP